MKNRILSIVRKSIPYSPEVKRMVGSTNAALVMQQLDYYFEKSPNGFYKFLEPANHGLCRPGDSWSEDLGFTLKEFLTAYDKIGVRYKSRTEFEAAPDKFAGRFYCCFVDRRSGNLTWYFRNHELVDKALDDLVAAQSDLKELSSRGISPPASPGATKANESSKRPTAKREVPRTAQTEVLGTDERVDQGNTISAVHRTADMEDQYTDTTTKISNIPTTNTETATPESASMAALV